MKRKVLLAAVVTSFATGALIGSALFLQFEKDPPPDPVACKTVLKASFAEVWQGRPDPLNGKMPEECVQLDKETYDRIALEVLVEVSQPTGA